MRGIPHPSGGQPPPGVRRRSLRTQLIVGNILTLALLLGVLGIVVRVTVYATIMASVDNELEKRTSDHGPPHGGPPPDGQHPPWSRDGHSPDDGPPPPDGDRSPQHDDGPPQWPPGRAPDVSPSGQFPSAGHASLFSALITDTHASDLGRPRHYTLTGQPLGDAIRETPRDRTAFARAAHGEIVYSTVSSPDGPLRIITRLETLPGPPSRSIREIVQAAYPLVDVNRAMAGLNRALLVLLPLGLLGAAAGGILLTGRVLERVRRLAQAAERVGAQGISERLPIAGQDEFADLAATFNTTLDRLEAAFYKQKLLMEQQRRFTADASHELKTPLTIIKGNTSMALLTTPHDDPSQPTLQQIDAAADTMSGLVQDLLLLARSDDGQLARNSVSLLAREVLERAVARTPSPSATISLRVPDEALCIFGSEGELVRLFGNLLDNAAQHTPLEGHIDIQAARAQDKVIVTITDNGAGIAPEHLAHLGERFYRTDASRARIAGGTGLGLSIVQGIVRAHDGSVAIESAVSVGTTVRVTLPADRSHAE